MSEAAKLLELAAKVEAANEPDRDLDGELAVALFGGEIIWKTANYTMEPYPARRHANADYVGGFCNGHVPLYTSSLDAVTALIAEKLPRWGWRLTQQSSLRADPSNALLYAPTIDRDFETEAATPALALLSATLRALASRHGSE